MNALTDRLKHVARRLQRSIEREERSPTGIVPDGETLQRRHCLHAVAVRLGFRSWPHATAVLQRTEPSDWGILMYRDNAGMTNIWSATYDEARNIHTRSGGFLLPYARQFQIVEAPYIELLCLNPAHPDWDAIGRDWVQPKDPEAWERITARRIDVVLSDDA